MNKLKEQLSKEYPFRIELHTHTKPVSACSMLAPERLAEIYAAQKVDGVCLTNHFYSESPLFQCSGKAAALAAYLKDYADFSAAAKRYGMQAYLGCEIRFAENHNDYLMYGVDEAILSEAYDYLGGTVEEYRRAVKLENTLFLQAHPFRDGMVEIDPALLDGLETLNSHPKHNSRVAATARYAKENRLDLAVGGSDYHGDGPFGDAAALLRLKELPRDSFALAAALRTGDYLIELGQNHLIVP